MVERSRIREAFLGGLSGYAAVVGDPAAAVEFKLSYNELLSLGLTAHLVDTNSLVAMLTWQNPWVVQ